MTRMSVLFSIQSYYLMFTATMSIICSSLGFEFACGNTSDVPHAGFSGVPAKIKFGNFPIILKIKVMGH